MRILEIFFLLLLKDIWNKKKSITLSSNLMIHMIDQSGVAYRRDADNRLRAVSDA